ncbi:MAG: FAD:protein FMN transferase [Wenzhouxiangella sp.]|nr:FAD:protein FMN transferase [Wenzhouxiangella sp.]
MAESIGSVRPGYLILCCVVALLAACSRPPQGITLNGETMGTYWTVRLPASPDAISIAELREQIDLLLDQVNQEMSTYRADSVISAFNRAEAGAWITLPPGFARVLSEALYWAEATSGAFDPTAGPLVNLWGFGPAASERSVPEPETIEMTLGHVGWQRLSFDADSDRLLQPGKAYLDLSGVAKGWGVDVVVEYLLTSGFSDFLVDIGGELRVQGYRADRERWRIGIERPIAAQREALILLELEDMALATSGDYRNHFEADGQRFSHLIDPRTGRPIDHATVAVTVASETCTTADALATALSVMPIDEAWSFAMERELAVLWLLADGEALLERMTPAFERLLQSGDS